MIDVDAYLLRLGHPGPALPDHNTLSALQLRHLRTIPFENLSIHAHEPIVLDEQPLFEKIVTRRRGGFCYELNGLFALLLERLGFHVDRLAARVCGKGGRFGPAFDHMTLLVHAEGDDYLVDVGFGDCFQQPMRLAERAPQIEGRTAYRIDDGPEGHTLHAANLREDPPIERAEYRFDRIAYPWSAFEPMCRYHQTSPDSHFTRNRICSIATPDGRLSLSDDRFIVTDEDGRRETPVGSGEEFDALLERHFGIRPDADPSSAARLRLSAE